MSPEDFIKAYESALKTQAWINVDPLFHENACVTFSNGTVHNGRPNVKIAFENNFATIKSEEYSIRDVNWIFVNESVAVYAFEYFWEGIINDKLVQGNGIGTSVLINENGKWVLLTENLSKKG